MRDRVLDGESIRGAIATALRPLPVPEVRRNQEGGFQPLEE